MAEAVSSIVAVVGTLLGASLTYLFQRRSSERTETVGFMRQLRLERLAAYAAFYSATDEYRRGQYDRWHRQAESPDSTAAFEAREESYRLKGAARHALAQIQLVAQSQTVASAAEHALLLTEAMHDAPDVDQVEASGGEAMAGIESVHQASGGRSSVAAPSTKDRHSSSHPCRARQLGPPDLNGVRRATDWRPGSLRA